MGKWFLIVKLIDLFCIKSQEKRSVQRETEAALQAALRASEWDRHTKGENITAKVSICCSCSTLITTLLSSLTVFQPSSMAKYQLSKQTFSQFFPDEPPLFSFSPSSKCGRRDSPGQVRMSYHALAYSRVNGGWQRINGVLPWSRASESDGWLLAPGAQPKKLPGSPLRWAHRPQEDHISSVEGRWKSLFVSQIWGYMSQLLWLFKKICGRKVSPRVGQPSDSGGMVPYKCRENLVWMSAVCWTCSQWTSSCLSQVLFRAVRYNDMYRMTI